MSFFFFFSSRRRHTRLQGDWSSDVCSSDLDQRGTSFVDEDGVNFVDNAEVQRALNHFTDRQRHVVTQEIEAELVVRPVGYVCRIRSLLRTVVHATDVQADGQAEEAVNLTHLLKTDARQVVVD